MLSRRNVRLPPAVACSAVSSQRPGTAQGTEAMPREDVGLLEGHVGRPATTTCRCRGAWRSRRRRPSPSAAAVLSMAPATTGVFAGSPSAAAAAAVSGPSTSVQATISGSLSAVDAAVAHEAVVVVDVVGVAVVGHPRGEDRVARGDVATGQAQVQVVEHVQELVACARRPRGNAGVRAACARPDPCRSARACRR